MSTTINQTKQKASKPKYTASKLKGFSTEELFDALFEISSRSHDSTKVTGNLFDEVLLVLDELYDRGEIQFKYYGGKQNNRHTIGNVTDSGKALTERFTNMIDAVAKRAVLEKLNPNDPSLNSVRTVIDKCFGIDNGQTFHYAVKKDRSVLQGNQLHNDHLSNLSLGRTHNKGKWGKISGSTVVMEDGAKVKTPNIRTVDGGIGISPETFEETIVNLMGSDKKDIDWLSGDFGSGSSTTLHYSDGIFIASRKQPHLLDANEKDRIVYTVALNNKYGERYGEKGSYLYIVDKNGNPLTVSPDKQNITYFDAGTDILHFNYYIEYHKRIESPDSIRKLINMEYPNPPLWISAIERRYNKLFEKLKRKERYTSVPADDRRNIKGNYNNLMFDSLSQGDKRNKVSYRRVMPFTVNYKGQKIKFKATFFILDMNEADIEYYIDNKHYPVIWLYNGQKHGFESRNLIQNPKYLNLPNLKKRTIIYLDTDDLDDTMKDDLFSSSRESVKRKGHLYKKIIETLSERVENDNRLQSINHKIGENVRKRKFTKSKEEIKRIASQFVGKDIGNAKISTNYGDKHKGWKLEPVTPSQDPTFITIDNKPDPIVLNKEKNNVIRCKADALDFYTLDHDKADLFIEQLDQYPIEVVDIEPFEDGYARIFVKPTDEAEIDEDYFISIGLKNRNGVKMSSPSRHFRIGSVPQKGKKKQKKKKNGDEDFKNVPDLIPVTEDDWGTLGYEDWDESTAGEVRSNAVHVNMNHHLVDDYIKSLEKDRNLEESTRETIREDYFFHWGLWFLMNLENIQREEENFEDQEKFEEIMEERKQNKVYHSIRAVDPKRFDQQDL